MSGEHELENLQLEAQIRAETGGMRDGFGMINFNASRTKPSKLFGRIEGCLEVALQLNFPPGPVFAPTVGAKQPSLGPVLMTMKHYLCLSPDS